MICFLVKRIDPIFGVGEMAYVLQKSVQGQHKLTMPVILIRTGLVFHESCCWAAWIHAEPCGHELSYKLAGLGLFEGAHAARACTCVRARVCDACVSACMRNASHT